MSTTDHDWLDPIIASQAESYGISLEKFKKIMSGCAETQQEIENEIRDSSDCDSGNRTGNPCTVVSLKVECRS